MSKHWIALAGVLFAANASAQGTLLDGQTMSVIHIQGISYTETVITGPVHSVVGPGVEVTGFGYQGFLDIDYSDRRILITARTDQAFGNTSILTFGDASGTIPDFVVARFDVAGISSFNLSATIITPNTIGLFFAPARARAGEQILITLNPITEPSAVVCVPGEVGVPDCPCTPPFFVPEPQSAPGHGCANSRFAGGAELAAYGLAVVGPPPMNGSSLALAVSNVPDALTIFLEGDAFAPDQGLFGDGVRCIGGNIKRFGDQIASGGGASYPRRGQTPISVVVAATHGSTRWYQAIYRNANAGWCSPATFNATNAIELFWH
jgi:hypothetical protein